MIQFRRSYFSIRRLSTLNSIKPNTKQLNKLIYYGIGSSILLGGTFYYCIKDEGFNQYDFTDLKLIKRIDLTKDTSLFEFETPTEIEFPILSHIELKHHLIQIKRSYTVIPTEFQLTDSGYKQKNINLIVKKYDDGAMTKFLFSRNIGDKIGVRGSYSFYNKKIDSNDHLVYFAAGTGITPFYQLLNILDGKQKITLFYFSKEDENILLKNEIEQFKSKYKDLDTFYFVESKTKTENNVYQGIVNEDLLRQYFKHHPINNNTKIMVCGPDGFLNKIAGLKKNEEEQGKLGGILKALNIEQDKVYKL